MLDELLRITALLSGLAVFVVGMLWCYVRLKTREMTGTAYQKAKPRDILFGRIFWSLFVLYAACILLLLLLAGNIS